MNILWQEIKNFSRENWWVYLIFFICIWFIYKTGTGNVLEISIVFFFHFMGDIFMMMMGEYYKLWDKRKWSISQGLSVIMFTIIGIYAYFYNGKINYLVSQIMFGFSSIKVYIEDVLWKKIAFFSQTTSLILGLITFWIYWYFDIVHTWNAWMQIVWFFSFANALILTNEKHRYFWSLFSISIIALSSWVETYLSYLAGNIKWIDISFTLLPLTVFVFYFKNITSYLWSAK